MDRERIGIAAHCWGGRVKLVMGEGTPPAIDLAPAIRCPVIGFFGNEDTNPTPQDVDDYDAALTRTGVERVFHRYDNAGHAFQSFNNPARYRPEASEDAWKKVLAFLAGKLKARQPGVE